MSWEQMRERFNTAALAARADTSKRDAFLRATMPVWNWAAGRLWQRWRRKLPSAVEREDVLQELLCQAVAHLGSWDPERGQPIGAFVYWGAYHRAQRRIHQLRGAKLSGNEGRNPSRPERTFSLLPPNRSGDDHGYNRNPEGFDVGQVADPASQTDETPADRAEAWDEALDACEDVRDALVLVALRRHGGDVAEAARAIWESFEARVACRVRQPEGARELVSETIARLAARVQEAADRAALERLSAATAA